MTNRHQFRANWHEYNNGTYFVTICCKNHCHYLGEIMSGEMMFSPIGLIAKNCLDQISTHFPDVELWNYVVMPNHIHLILHIPVKENPLFTSSLKKLGCLKPQRHNAQPDKEFHHNSRLSVIIGQFKSTVTRKAKELNIQFQWQKRYHDHIIRDRQSFIKIMNYIELNIVNWQNDCFYN